MRLAISTTLSLLLLGLSRAHPQYPSGGGGVDEDAIAAAVASFTCEAYTHDCVPHYQCINGEINTSGEGLIDIRTKPPKSCVNPEYPEVPSFCCRIPGATTPAPPTVIICPGEQVCLLPEQCTAEGTANTDGVGIINTRLYSNCYVTPGSQVIGVCCKPPIPTIEICPHPSACLPKEFCFSEILDDSQGYQPFGNQATWLQCPIPGSPQDKGVCCRDPPAPIAETCPEPSVCRSLASCKGNILDDSDAYQPHGSQAIWTQCPLNGNYDDMGICCQEHHQPLTAADRCGIRNDGLRLKTLNKNEASFAEFPWQAILFFSNYTFKCGATLVTDRHLLTGAHCVHGHSHGNFKIRLGEWTVNTYDEPLAYVDVDIASITIHPNFNSANLHNDIAVIELVAPVKFQYHINTACLPTLGQSLLPGTRCFASGWGKNAFEGNFQITLKKVDVPFVEHGYCQNLLRATRLGKYFLLDKSFMCAGGEENQDACTGDGGGPLVCEDPVTGAYNLWGITAWGINCGQKNVPGVYVDIQAFADWISQAMFGVAPVDVTAPHNPYGRK